MQIQLNASNGIENKEALDRWADGEIRTGLARFVEDVTRVEVHLSDENSGRGGSSDKRCTMEARLTGHPPVAVTHDAATLDEAFRGGMGKLVRVIEHTLAKRDHKRDRVSIRKDAEAAADVAPSAER